jgi:hypothetical protein
VGTSAPAQRNGRPKRFEFRASLVSQSLIDRQWSKKCGPEIMAGQS